MQMSGEPITLENIESNIKKTFNVDDKVENGITKLLLLPFRVASQVFKVLGPFAEFLVSAGRVFVGGIMTFTGIIVIIASFFALFVSMSAIDNMPVYFFDIPLGLFGRDASSLMLIGGFLAFAVPFFVIAWAGISLMIRKNLFTPTVWQSALGVFVVGLLITMYTGVRYAKNFAKTASIEKVTTYNIAPKTPLFEINSMDGDFNWKPSIELEGYDGTTIEVKQTFKADGKDKQDAEKNTADIEYKITQKDSVLSFDERFEYKDNARFRDQKIIIKLRVPYDKEFIITREFAYFVENVFARKYFDNLDEDEFKNARWKLTREGEIVCTNKTFDSEDENNDNENGSQTLDVKDFEFIKSDVNNGICNYEIRQGNEFKVEVEGAYDKNELKYEVKDNTLSIKNKDNNVLNVRITMPKLKGIILKGGNGESKISDFSGDDLTVELHDSNKLYINGSVQSLTAKLKGFANLQAFDLQAVNANIEARDNAEAEINVKKKMDVKTSGMAKIRYRGEPSENHSVSDGGTIEKE
jgi:Putative auto-transporter adhesin, head GIN domain